MYIQYAQSSKYKFGYGQDMYTECTDKVGRFLRKVSISSTTP